MNDVDERMRDRVHARLILCLSLVAVIGSACSAGSMKGGGLSPPVSATALYQSVCVGDQHTCAVTASGDVTCWGRNYSRQLGVSDYDEVAILGDTVPLPSSDPIAKRVACRGRTSCAIMTSGALYCWGVIFNDLPVEAPPTKIADSVADVAISDFFHACLVTTAGAVRCWGDNGDSQLGTVGAGSATPIDVPGISDAVGVTAGWGHSCAVLRSGTVQCWGRNVEGQLGAATSLPFDSPPVTVPGVSASAVAAGALHTCVVTTAGKVQCWGKNDSGQIGNGSVDAWFGGANNVTTKPLTANVRAAVAIAASDRHTCAIADSGAVYCFGNDGTGQLGTGPVTTAPQPDPHSVGSSLSQLNDARIVSTGFWHSCALQTSGRIRCWGRNDAGQLTNGGTRDSWEPVP